MYNSGEFLEKHGEGNINVTWIVDIKILPLAYHHSHFLTATLDFTSFSQ